MTDMRIVLAVALACILFGALCIRLSIKAAQIRPATPVKPADRQPEPTPGDCEYCGWPLASTRITYCTSACRLADMDHGPNGDDQ